MSDERKRPAASPWTWLLALCFLFAIDAAVTRTSLLWGPSAFEHTAGLRTLFPQTYQVARKIYAPADDADARVAVLGNSRAAMALKEKRIERAITEVAPGLDVDVANLAVFGSFIGDTQVLARHLDAMSPALVVLAVGGVDLIRKPMNLPEATRLLRIGWRDGPFDEDDWSVRLDRWLRTVWPLYRFREFARAAILDRVLMREDPGPPPETFDSRRALFAHLYPDRTDEVLAAWSAFEETRTLEAYAAYLEATGAGHLARGRERAKSTEPLTRETPSVAVFDALVGELAAADRPTLILLMPENPILADDRGGEFHRPELPGTAAALVLEIAARHRVPVVDARAWLPVESFLDFDHPIIDLDRFDAGLAAAIARELAARPSGKEARG